MHSIAQYFQLCQLQNKPTTTANEYGTTSDEQLLVTGHRSDLRSVPIKIMTGFKPFRALVPFLEIPKQVWSVQFPPVCSDWTSVKGGCSQFSWKWPVLNRLLKKQDLNSPLYIFMLWYVYTVELLVVQLRHPLSSKSEKVSIFTLAWQLSETL